VIVKAHDSHLGTNALVAEVILEAARTSGMPDGVFSSLIGDGFATGKQLVVHPLTAAVGFTGSKAGGRALYDLGQQRENPIPVFAEMGSVNPVFLLPGKIAEDPATLASQLVISMTMTVGQFCTNPGILVAIDDAHTSGLVAAMIEALDKVPGGIMLNASIQKTFYAGVAEINDAKGTTMVYGSVSDTGSATTPVLATVRADVFLAHPRLHHEVFGPFSLLVLCQDIQQMRHVAEAIEGQLTATVQATEAELTHAYSLAEPLMERAGRIILNGVPTGVEVCAAMTHGGPYPASTDSRYTAVGHHAVKRWLRPVTFQNWPSEITSGLFSI
jgi:NADP-dependent aldehyde dehydrogenase